MAITDNIVHDLRRQIGNVGCLSDKPESREIFSSGCGGLDRLLPKAGFRGGQLIEWLAARPASGASTLALVVARQACQAGGALVICDRRRSFYPPAAALWGIDPRQLIVIRACSIQDELWAIDQTMRSPAVAAVLASVERLDAKWFRRLQLAAESGQTLGMLLRPARVRGQPTWSDVQLLVHPRPSRADGRRVRVEAVRCRGGTAGSAVELELDPRKRVIQEVNSTRRVDSSGHETHSLYLATQLAHPTPARRSARA